MTNSPVQDLEIIMQKLEEEIIGLIASGEYKKALDLQVHLNAKNRLWRETQLAIINELKQKIAVT